LDKNIQTKTTVYKVGDVKVRVKSHFQNREELTDIMYDIVRTKLREEADNNKRLTQNHNDDDSIAQII
jgi:hypothetical protein